MKRLTAIAAITAALATPVAHTQTIPAAAFIPSPVGMIITAGSWLIKENEKVYYIELYGQGVTVEEAKLNGFRLAVEQAVGSLIASESVVENSQLKRDEIISYASGYVSKSEIGAATNNQGIVRLPMKVWIKRSALANRLLNKSETAGQVEGTRVAVQYQTLMYEREQADRVIQLVLNDFPQRAYNIEAQPAQVTFDGARQVRVQIPYTVQWNSNYLSSLHEALQKTSQNPKAGNCWNAWQNCQNSNYLKIIVKTGFFNWQNTVGFDDYKQPALVAQNLVESQPAILLTIRNDHNQVVHKSCQILPRQNMVEQGQIYTLIDGRSVLKQMATVTISQNSESLSALQHVDLQAVRSKDCPI